MQLHLTKEKNRRNVTTGEPEKHPEEASSVSFLNQRLFHIALSVKSLPRSALQGN